MATIEQLNQSHETWNEGASTVFIENGEAFVPWRADIATSIVNLVPASGDERFTVVDIGAGTGWLSEAVLNHFPAANVVAYDGSPMMVAEAGKLLRRFDVRANVRAFRLQDSMWLDELQQPVRAFVSCLVIHHLDGAGKEKLYNRLFEHLQPGGAVLFADVIEPQSSHARSAYEASYESDVRDHSVKLNGNLDAYERFLDLEWNLFRFPDPIDKPSAITEHLDWLRQAGFVGVEVFWARSGHALYGGYKPASECN